MQIYPDDRREQPQRQLPCLPSAPSDALTTWPMEALHVSDTGIKSKSTGVKKR